MESEQPCRAPGALRAGSLALAICLAVQACSAPLAAADDPVPAILEGEVVRVSDGDSLTLLVAKRPIRVRLAQIDAPERGQPYGQQAKKELSRLAFGRQARAVVVDIDDYGRSVAEVFVDGVHLNQSLVRSGHAWAYTRYARSTEIIDLESQARSEQRGLWRLLEAERDPPWEWRRRKRRGQGQGQSKRPPRARSKGSSASFECGAKRTCSEMQSCAEALFYLEHCGLGRIDGDGDGAPCESRCSQR
jgi:endonuclease YncB( thermonuclease family)